MFFYFGFCALCMNCVGIVFLLCLWAYVYALCALCAQCALLVFYDLCNYFFRCLYTLGLLFVSALVVSPSTHFNGIATMLL